MSLALKKLFLLDMDGTLYIDDRLFAHTPAFLQYIRQSGGRYIYLTNNSSRSVDTYVQKMRHLGLDADPVDFFTSTQATIHYLLPRYSGRLLYAFGTAAFRQELADADLLITDRLQDNISALIIGFDTELTFQKIEDACILLNRGVDFIATNPDLVCPTGYGFVPDCGSVCRMLTTATGREPLVIGKPKPEMAQLAMQKFGCTPGQTLLVGDRIYTDIACGAAAGVDTVLVLSGETTAEQAVSDLPHPTYLFKDIGQLLQALQSAAKETTT